MSDVDFIIQDDHFMNTEIAKISKKLMLAP